MNKILATILWVMGLTLIVMGFFYFGKNLETSIRALLICVTSFIFSLYFIDVIFPAFTFKNKSFATVGSLGLRGFFTGLYTVLAIAGMIIFNTTIPLVFSSQLIFQCAFLFLLLVGIYFSIEASNQVKTLYADETGNRYRIDKISRASEALSLQAKSAKLSPEIIKRVENLKESIRFITPSNDLYSQEIEDSLLHQINSSLQVVMELPPDESKILLALDKCDEIYRSRKSVFSN